MATYLILTKLVPGRIQSLGDLKKLSDTVAERIKSDCPGVQFKESYATMGSYDVIDVVEAKTPGEVEKAAMIIRTYGNATTETLFATPWKEFVASM